MIKWISIILTHFFQFNQHKILLSNQVTYFLKLNLQYFLQCGGVVKWAYFQKKVEYPFKTEWD